MDYVIRPQLMRPNGGEVLLSGTFVEVVRENPQGWRVETATRTYSEDGSRPWPWYVTGPRTSSVTETASSPVMWQGRSSDMIVS